MSLLDTLRTGVKLADSITKPLQATVSYWRYTGSDGFGTKTYNPPQTSAGIQLRAIVDWKQKQVRTQTGVLSVSRASVMFLDNAAVVAATAGQGIGDNDLIILPDGTTGPIIDMAGFIDAGTTHPLATEVFLG